jgi:hypothetical protein
MGPLSVAGRIAKLEKSLNVAPDRSESESPPASNGSAPARVEPVDAEDEFLPKSYGRNRLVMMAVNPRRVHAYWEVTPERLAQASGDAADSLEPPSAALRFYDATAASFDVPVDLRPGSWYVNLWSPGQTYYAELGLKTDAGQFVPLARSNVVRTPRAWPVVHLKEHFMQVEPAEPRAELVSPPAFIRPRREPPPVVEEPIAQPPDSVQATPQETTQPLVARPAEGPFASEFIAPARVDSAAIVRAKLTELYALRPPPRARSPFQAIDPVPASNAPPRTAYETDFAALAEQRFVAGIFSHTTSQVTEKD